MSYKYIKLLLLYAFSAILVFLFSQKEPDTPFYNVRVYLNVFTILLLLSYSFLVILSNEDTIKKYDKIFFYSLIFILIVLPIFINIISRYRASNPLVYAHDGGVIQTEESARLLLNGKNPYSANFKNTPLINVGEMGIIVHNPYLPLSFIITIPFIYICDKLNILFDQRIIYLVFYFSVIFFSVYVFKSTNIREVFKIFFAFNPLLIPFLIHGMNEIYIISLLFISYSLLISCKFLSSFLVLGLACSTKQFAWLIAPFFIIYLKATASKNTFYKSIFIFIITLLVFILPFFIWSHFDFIDDTLLFNAGRSFVNYPLGGTPGIGFSMIHVVSGFVKDKYQYFPCILFIIIFCLPLFIYLLIRLYREPLHYNIFLYGAIFSSFFIFFSRVFHLNYLFFILFLLAVGIFNKIDLKSIANIKKKL
ncbi:MAG: hypothetical protein AB1765_07705 [Candidatus Hydrogenedentota bacterium]